MQHKAKPHTIEGFQLQPGCITPQWFEDAKEKGMVQVVDNHKERHVTIYDKKGGVRKAYLDNRDWVCMNKSGTIFPLTREEYQRGFQSDDMR